MKLFFEESTWAQWVEIELNPPRIIDFQCTCPDFTFRRLSRESDGPDTKIVTKGQCKHLKSILNNKEIGVKRCFMLGFKKCPDWLKEAYKEAAEFTCELCGAHDELEIHRIKRGNQGGTYIPHNIKVICNKCHSLVHGTEFR